jgi:leucyl-tRNA synthetase
MSSDNIKYQHSKIEKKWQDIWEKEGLYCPSVTKASNPFYNLWMFPYPSAEGLHAGHAFASTGSDIYARYKRMNGKVVFQPIGYDSFGIHSENFALKAGVNPTDLMAKTTKHYKSQLKSLGHGYDWTRTVTTSSPEYYRWTEWLFSALFKAGLAYKKKANVNFCPSCKTVLADEQVMTPRHAGKEPKDARGHPVPVGDYLRICERCGTVVERRELAQWFFRITEYADKLLDGLTKIDWSERVKIAQKEWIGKSKGLSIDFKLYKSKKTVTVWTKFWETVYGATFLVVSPEYAKDNLLQSVPEKSKSNVNKYINISLNKTQQERSEMKEKTGVEMGIFVQNPVNGERVPVFVADYVLANVGTGAVMGVPAHDERDFIFAKKYNLPIRKVVDVQVETYSLVVKKSVEDGFLDKVKKKGWYFTEYEDWGWEIVFPKGSEEEYINLVQDSLRVGPWYVHTDGALKEIIFKNRHFSIERQNQDAKKYARDLKVPEEQLDWDDSDHYMFAHEKGGKIVNSGQFDGLDAWGKGKEEMAKWMIKEGIAHREVNYHLRDWLISRQRYWGCPIPMIYCEKCAQKGEGWLGLNKTELLHKDNSDWDWRGWWPEENLPVKLPYIKDWKPEGTGKGPLANHPDYFETKCPHCNAKAIRETDVADTFLDSSWYFLRYPSVGCQTSQKLPFDPEITKKWLPVDLYFGGAEHAVLHLMYSRFVTMALHDLKFLDFSEPFPKFFAHGLVIKDGAKMSKSRGNVVNPDEYIEKYGADTLRLYLMFMGPMDGYPDFRDTGIEGMRRFTERVWKLYQEYESVVLKSDKDAKEILVKMHQTIKKVSEDIQEFKYNTAIAAIMELINLMYEKVSRKTSKDEDKGFRCAEWDEALKTLCLLLAPFAPHATEELFSIHSKMWGLSKYKSIHVSSWPKFDPDLIREEKLTIIVQVNGKVRSQLAIDARDAKDKKKIIGLARDDGKTLNWLQKRTVQKEIFVPGKLVNFVVDTQE